jgi:general secretion pathway protein D
MIPTLRMKKTSVALLLAAAPMLVTPLLAGEGYRGGGVPGIAEREITRRMARIEDARRAMETGDQFYAKGDYEAALSQYRSAKEIFDQLPDAPYIQDWRGLANLKFADCAYDVAHQRAAKGDYPGARKLLEEALLAVPGHKKCLHFSSELNDIDRWPPALTAQHVENVGKVREGLQIGNSAVELGRYDEAINQYEDVLRTDPYNIAARRGMERAEQRREEYFRSARDHQRIRMLNMVNEAWENKPPQKNFQVSLDNSSVRQPSGYLTEKMQKIIFPQIQFTGASVEEAIEFLRVKSADLDVFETDPSKKGVNILYNPGENPSSASISLDVRNVPMTEALRYVTDLAGLRYKVEPFAVIVQGVGGVDEMFTRTYKVTPDFETSTGGSSAEAAPAADPFNGGGAAAPVSSLGTRKKAKEILSDAGITFPEGATAVFNKSTSQLVVKNTQPNLDLVESYVDTLINKVTKLVNIQTKFVEVTQKNTDELGFDWFLGGNSSDDVSIGGGTTGNSGVVSSFAGTALAPLVTSGAVAPVSRGLRSGTNAIRGDSIDSLFTSIPAGSDTVSPGVLSVAGILTDPQFGAVVRALSQKKGVDLMTAPNVTTKGGNQANIEVIREFIYPTEFDPPQIPTNVGSTNLGVGGGLGGAAPSIPVTPTTPTAFTMRPVGVRLEVDPVIGENGAIDLNLVPEVTEFDGFVNYGSPINSVQPQSITSAIGGLVSTTATTIVLTPNVINQPIFSIRKVKTSVTVWDGSTVALGGLMREDVQDVEDKLPILGDLPVVGRLFRSEVEDHFKRNLMIFVTANLIDPSGQKIKQTTNSDPGLSAANPLLPAIGGQ